MNNNRLSNQDMLDYEEDMDMGSKGGRSDSLSNDQPKAKSGRRGFASMDPSKQREIASKGGKAAHRQGTAHEWDSFEAKEAGAKGGRNKRR